MTKFYKNTLCSFLLLISVASLNAQTIRYVKQGGAGTGDGSSWANASADVQAMINISGWFDQIWVAGGTYKPNRPADNLTTISANNRDNAFVLMYGTKLYGGFAGTETKLAQRNLKLTANASILSGDFLNDDVVTGSGNTLTFTNNTENAYHVVINISHNSSPNFPRALLDGFTVKGGNASGTGTTNVDGNLITKNYGGGIHCVGNGLTVENLILTENSANFGAALFNQATDFRLNRVNINTNRANNQGSAVQLGALTVYENTSHVLSNCVITNNRATNGTINVVTNSSNVQSLIMVHCTIADNSATGGGIMRASGGCSIQIYYSILATATPSTGISSLSGAFVTVSNSLIPAGLATINYSSGNLSGSSPQFKNAAGGDYSLLSASPAINTCSNSTYAGERDAAQNRRISGTSLDMGAYEYQAPKATPNAQGIVFVKKNSTGNGSSWANALGELATALDAAKEINAATPGTITQIWVAGGTYKPLLRADNLAWENTTDKDNAFVMVNNVKVYGNFAGTETTLADRNVKLTANASVLSGDFSGNDIMTGSGSTLSITNNTENAYHVVVAAGNIGNALLDGFTVKGGNANVIGNISVNGVSVNYNTGGGITINESSLPVSNTLVTGNAANSGGGIINWYSPSEVSNTIFDRNIAEHGSAIYIVNDSYNGPAGSVINSLFTNNNSETVFYYDDGPGAGIVVTNCSFAGNSAAVPSFLGYLADSSGSAPQFRNCIIDRPETGNLVKAFGASADDVIFQNTLTSETSLGNNPANTGNILNADPQFTNAATGDYTLAPASPAKNAGNTSYFTGAATATDLAGNPRLYGAAIDMGAYEIQGIIITPNADGVLFVKKNASGNGSSWNNALGEVADALKAAKELNTTTPGTITQIWVAGGIYKPMYRADTMDGSNATDRDNAFLMVSDVRVYGNFAGTETALADRNVTLAANASILSGDYNGNDAISGSGSTLDITNNTENAYHVVVASGIMGTVLLDGFTVTGGYSDGPADVLINGQLISQAGGAGIINYTSSLKIKNTLITGNFAIYCGGILSISSSLEMDNMIFNKNKSDNGGGIYVLNDGYAGHSGIFNNCLFTNHSSPAGVIFFDDGSGPGAVFTNCTFAGNTGSYVNFLYYYNDSGGSAPQFRNSIISTPSGGFIGGFNASANNVIFQNTLTNVASLGNNAANTGNILNANPQFTNSATGDYSLKVTSPAINAGNDAYFTDAATATDLAGNARLSGTIDIGAYEYQGSTDCGITTTWNGTAWDNGTPTSNVYAAVIAGAYTSTGNLTACSLTVNSGAVVVNPAHNFIIKGVVDVAGGSLTFEDNANLVQADDVDNSGSITYKKDSNPLRYLDYTLWSSPTTGTQKLKDFSTETLDTRFYVYNTALSAYSNYTSASGIFGSNPNAVGFTPAKGYLIRMPDGLPATGTTVFTGVFTGVPNNGDTSIAAPVGFNAVGNPYPSPINVHNFIDANNTILDNDGTLYFWRKTNDTAEPTYATINKLAYVKNTAPGGDTGTGYFAVGNEANWVINPGQGFLVKSLGGSINFTNSMRRAINTGQFFRMENQTNTDSNNAGYTDVSRYYINITNATGNYGETAIAYTAMATTGLDYGFDGRLVNDGAISIYSLSGSTKLAIQARPQFNDTDVVPLGYKVTTAGTYTVTIAQQDNLFANGQQVYLKDNLTGTTHQLNQGSYIFTTEAGNFTGRFEVVYVNGTLGITNPVAALNSLIVYTKDGNIHITNGTTAIADVKVFDTRGRLVAHKNGINNVQATISSLNVQQQVLLVQVTTTDNATTTKKIIL